MNYANFPLDKRKPLPSSDPVSADDFIDVERLLGMAARQAKVVAACAAIGLFLGVLYLQTTPPTYMATSRVLIDEGLNKVVDEVSAASVSMQTDSAILSQIEILHSARLAAVVVDKQKLDQNDAFMNPPTSAVSKAAGFVRGVVRYFRPNPAVGTADVTQLDPATRDAMIASSRRDYAILKLQDEVQAERIGRSYVISIAYQATDPALATAVTKAYADAYLADQLDASFDATERAAVWLQGRLTELRESSQAAALAVEKFRAEHGLAVDDGQLISDKQLSDLNGQLIEAQADTARASARYQQYKSIVESGSDNAFRDAAISADQPSNSIISTLKTRYLTVAKRQQDIEANFGAEHPQAVALAKERADISAQIFGELKQLTESYRNEYEVALARETALRANVALAAGKSSIDNQSQVKLRELEQKATALSTLYQTFLGRYEEASQQQSFPVGKIRVISDATLPKSAATPRTSIVLGLSLVLGVMLGAGVGGLNEFRERFFRTGEDVRDRVGLKFLGYLPIIGSKVAKDDKRDDGQADIKTAQSASAAERRARMRVSIDAPASMFSETLRSAKIAFDVVMEGQGSRVIGVISVLPGEGKSTVAANLAGLLAANGSKTLLVDGDLRNPGLSRSLGMEAEQGLMEAVVSGQTWQSVGKIDRQTKLAIVPAVPRGHFSHTSELLSSAGMRRFIDNAKETFQYIVVDLPPLGPVVDAKAFAPLADGFVLVTEWGRTPRAMVQSILSSESYIANKIVGVVLNKVDLKKLAKYGSIGGSEKFFDRYSSYYLEKSEARTKVNS
ncbi:MULTISPECIES: polysaccharide biosynthesis tyrosine autokinase [unclassified Mesorhizobium]|uniref:polysaccharide biosynthesis tyrosine autokinase n=1 Tax=unclassified Mesorhizobium TaxID=325217 RepID=UPI0003CFA4F9|nr:MULTISPECIES: polysaccharide biosynthesis tyrosine autokinase [unclassified Mesorhizobium]ESZ22468.1 chain-length determining protein [Mesorhizobium sp. L48C026A00]RWB02202.1 MAG: polysaccharide biosynthesis tyrosine autokinase [Mesorhizobium sp.]RWN61891.1 MAG: polysaccharide biosynthesis tyrosine autokinase [Mesorhizobium sp.]RWO02673.1 MAG: polysaccharide biosynthesis tyrosine autokinase [Mesorhizobium sp.]TIL60931.1 MAG: polysaccharide biosynthesis tyrosine autokinase [Mesorhizobium sp.